MRIADCFVDLFAYVALAVDNPADAPSSGDELCRTVSDLAAASKAMAEDQGLDETAYDKARFAVFAWIDETVMKSDFEGKTVWQRQLLQRTHYQTTGAGVEFYRRLEALEEEDTEIREVFFLCLALGFSGRYGQNGDDLALRHKIGQEQFRRLAGPANLLSPTDGVRLFPEAYGDRTDPGPGNPPRSMRSRLMPLVLGAGPVVVFLFLYGLYRFILNHEILIHRIQ